MHFHKRNKNTKVKRIIELFSSKNQNSAGKYFEIIAP
jgi:hypothetical protein